MKNANSLFLQDFEKVYSHSILHNISDCQKTFPQIQISIRYIKILPVFSGNVLGKMLSSTYAYSKCWDLRVSMSQFCSSSTIEAFGENFLFSSVRGFYILLVNVSLHTLTFTCSIFYFNASISIKIFSDIATCIQREFTTT